MGLDPLWKPDLPAERTLNEWCRRELPVLLKYEENLKAFREEYAAMPLHEKAMENKWLAGGSVVATLLVIVGLLVIGGII